VVSLRSLLGFPPDKPIEEMEQERIGEDCELLILLVSLSAATLVQTTHCQGSGIELPAGQATYENGQATCTTATSPPPPQPMTTQEAYQSGQNLGHGIAGIRGWALGQEVL
jgi:hypothetical protein